MDNFNNIKFRCSSIGYLMTEPREKSPAAKYAELLEQHLKLDKEYDAISNKKSKSAINKMNAILKNLESQKIYKGLADSPFLSETCITHLVDVYVSAQWDRREEKENKFLEKGNEREEDAITLLSRVTKTFYTKNDERKENDFISGEMDLKREAPRIITDIKNSWSAFTYFRSKFSELKSLYYWQMQGYIDLWDAEGAEVAFCLVNGTANAIMAEKNKAKWASKFMDVEQDPEYKAKCRQIEINHIFDIEHFNEENPGFDFDNDIDMWLSTKKWDIPMAKRVNVIEVPRCDEDIERMHKRIIECRQFMNANF